MNILYGIQGTGHGHISRAREILPALSKHASVDVLISGRADQPHFQQSIKYRKYGISLTYDSEGGVSVLETLLDFRPVRFIYDVQSVSLDKYDLVITDYEPVSAWSAKLNAIPSVALSHQAAFLSHQTPRPQKRSLLAEVILQRFAPADHIIGFHFKRYDDFIEPPVIRSAIRKLKVSEDNHFTVYLPAYHPNTLQQILAPFSHVDWHIFSPMCSAEIQQENFWIRPVSDRKFLDSIAACRGVICNAGFETCAEAMYLGKKLLAIPIRNQYEQACNAAALRKLGVLIFDSLDDKAEGLWHWMENQKITTIDEIADSEEIVQQVLQVGTSHKRAPVQRSGSVSSLGL